MNNFITITAGLATISVIGITSYQLGSVGDAESSEEIKVNIVNSLDSTISSLPIEKREAFEELLIPLKELVKVASDTRITTERKTRLENAEKGVRKVLNNISLVSYKAKDSPFVPPINKVQLLRDGNFSFTYRG